MAEEHDRGVLLVRWRDAERASYRLDPDSTAYLEAREHADQAREAYIRMMDLPTYDEPDEPLTGVEDGDDLFVAAWDAD